VTVPFKELAGSPIENYGANGINAQRKVVCSWADRYDLRDELLGDGYSFNTTPAAVYPNNEELIAMTVRIEPFNDAPPGWQGQLSTTQFDEIGRHIADYDVGDAESKTTRAMISISYELIPLTTLTWPTGEAPGDPEPQTFLTYRRSSSTEYMLLKGGAGFRWEDDLDLEPPKESFPTLRIPVTDHILTWHRVLDPPWEAINLVKGTVNRDAFFGFPEQTILFDKEESERQFYMFGSGGGDPLQAAWRITYTFRERQIKFRDQNGDAQIGGWCHTWREEPTNEATFARLTRATWLPQGGPAADGIWDHTEDPDGNFIFIYDESGATIANANVTAKDFLNLFRYQHQLPSST
jgi:hypothetical protein